MAAPPAHGLQLECLNDDLAGRRMSVHETRPLTFAVKREDDPSGEIVIAWEGDDLVAANRSQRTMKLDGVPGQRFVLNAGQELTIGRLRFRVVATAPETTPVERRTTPLPALGAEPVRSEPPRSEPDTRSERSDSQAGELDPERLKRRISASKLAAVEDPKANLLGRVSSYLTGRQDRLRLSEIETERSRLLAEAGRLSLTGGGLGLSPRVMAAVMRGEAISVGPGDWNSDAIDRWRSMRVRVSALDTEIAALRRSLKLGSDTGAIIPPAESPTSTRARTERSFATMDGLDTDDLTGSSAAS